MPLGHLFSSCVRSAKRHPPPPRPLAHSPWLQELELALNEITPDGASAVAAAVANKQHLVK